MEILKPGKVLNYKMTCSSCEQVSIHNIKEFQISLFSYKEYIICSCCGNMLYKKDGILIDNGKK